MQRTRIKFCGITRVEDALEAARLGVDAVGVVLARASRRCAGLAAANAIRRALPPFVTMVALFMDDDIGYVAEAVAATGPDCLQFHGGEPGPDCVRYARPYLKAVPMGAGGDWRAVVSGHPRAAGFVFDGHGAGEQGGSGRAFDWAALPAGIGPPVILAGGLNPENVAAAIRRARPHAVDVSSGIESGTPGIKDAETMRRFVAAVRATDEGR